MLTNPYDFSNMVKKQEPLSTRDTDYSDPFATNEGSKDLDYFDSIEPIEEEQPTSNRGTALLGGLAQGVTLGYEDEIWGGLTGAYDALTTDKSFSDAYRDNRDAVRNRNRTSQEDHTGLYIGGEIAGGVGSAVLAPIGAGVRGGAVIGGLYGHGTSESNTLGGQALDTAVGAGLGAAGAKTGELLGNAASGLKSKAERLIPTNLGRAVQNKAADNTARFLGADKLGLPDNQMRELGRTALDKNLIKSTKPENVRKALTKENENLNEALLSETNDLGLVANNSTYELSADKLTKLGRDLQLLDSGTPEYIALKKFLNRINTLGNNKSGSFSTSNLVEDLVNYSRKSDFGNPNPSNASLLAREEYALTAKALDDAIQDTLKKRNLAYRESQEILNILGKFRNDTEQFTRDTNLARTIPNVTTHGTRDIVQDGDKITSLLSQAGMGGLGYSASGYVSDDPLIQTGVGVGAALMSGRLTAPLNKFYNKVATKATTTGLDKVGKAISRPITKPNNQEIKNFGKFTGVLEQAKREGSHKFSITYNALFNQSQEFRELVRGQANDE